MYSRRSRLAPLTLLSQGLWGEVFDVVGLELRALWLLGVGENHASGLPPIGLDCWSPNININRDPRWGRAMEVPSEDPHLNARYGVAYAKNLQRGNDKRYLRAVATLKHWAAYSLEDVAGTNTTRFNYDAEVSAFDLADTYFPAWKASVTEGGAKGVMCSYNALNGVPTCASQALNATLRGAWGFDGYVTSDSGAVMAIGDGVRDGKGKSAGHHYAKDEAEAVAMALAAGTDVNSDQTTDHSTSSAYIRQIPDGIASGAIPQEHLTSALVNSLALRFELGLFDPTDDQPYWHVPPEVVQAEAHVALSQRASAASLVLAANANGALPFKPGASLAVVGPHANATAALLGNYLGQVCNQGYGDTSCVESMGSALANRNLGADTAIATIPVAKAPAEGELEAAVKAAASADLVLLALGVDTTVEREGSDRTSLELPGMQMELVRRVAALGKSSTAAVVLCGGALALEELTALVPSVLVAFYPGQFASGAIADAVFGKASPGGKLPVTFFKAGFVNESDFASMDMTLYPGRTYRYYVGKHLLWPFGLGLSYTSFALAGARWEGGTAASAIVVRRAGKGALRAAAPAVTAPLSADGRSGAGRSATLRVALRNTGAIKGATVVQLYMRPAQSMLDAVASDRLLRGVAHAVASLRRRLVAFRRVDLDAGEMSELAFAVDVDDLALVDASGNRVVVSGQYELDVEDGSGAFVAGGVRVEVLGSQATVVLEKYPVPSVA